MKYKVSAYKDYFHLFLYLVLAATTPLAASMLIAYLRPVAM